MSEEKVSDVTNVLHSGVVMFISTEAVGASEPMQASVVAVSDDEFALTIPIKDGYFHTLAKDTKFEAFFYRGSGKYLLKTVVQGRVLLNNKPVLVCSMPLSLTRTERREYYRVDTFFPVKVLITSVVNTAEGQRVVTDTYNAHCVDMSGGGLQLDPVHSENIPLKLNETVEIDFCEALTEMSKAKVIAVRPPVSGKAGWGIKFTKILGCDRDKIIRYTFKKQLNAKKGKEKQEEENELATDTQE